MIHQPISSAEAGPARSKRRSIVVLSGGMDSTVTALLARAESDLIGGVHFEYGQRHSVEKMCAIDVAVHLGIPLYCLPCNTFSALGDSALVRPEMALAAHHPQRPNLPASFVPGRNLVFLTFAAALAMKQGADVVYTGVCQTDFSGYPDCRSQTIQALELALREGMAFPDLELRTPLMYLTKAQTFRIADDLGELRLVVEHTHTCYQGSRENMYEWGAGCGECPACHLRREGWLSFVKQRRLGSDA